MSAEEQLGRGNGDIAPGIRTSTQSRSVLNASDRTDEQDGGRGGGR